MLRNNVCAKFYDAASLTQTTYCVGFWKKPEEEVLAKHATFVGFFLDATTPSISKAASPIQRLLLLECTTHPEFSTKFPSFGASLPGR
ncbi:hypothetical protein Zmor_009993 [Zophobas morio]|uniref:Uncharacterized protein n=1 Tax=Zophobas morio TaxID=2755281 RepID=A0AA38IQR2_9CUCU|nr:hypothetical protein Zmor_009993 [Zophobas morio]